MPIHEFRCVACGRRSSHYFGSIAAAEMVLARLASDDLDLSGLPICPHCGSHDLRRLFGRFALRRGSGGGQDTGTKDEALAGINQDDPREVARWAQRMAHETDMDGALGGDFHEALGRIEQGENPDRVMGDYDE